MHVQYSLNANELFIYFVEEKILTDMMATYVSTHWRSTIHSHEKDKACRILRYINTTHDPH